MGRPCSRGVILRDHGTERPKGLPTMGTAPKTQKLTRCKKRAMTSEGLFRRLAHSFLATIDKDTRQTRSDTYSISYNIASKRRNDADTQQTRKLARVISSGPRAEGVGHSPPRNSWLENGSNALQKPVFALPGCQRTSLNTLWCDTLGLAEIFPV